MNLHTIIISSILKMSRFYFHCLIFMVFFQVIICSNELTLFVSAAGTSRSTYSVKTNSAAHAEGEGCPSSKLECDKSPSCHWSDRGRCISSIPCVLEPTQSRCELNTIGCRWQGNQCERRVKTIVRGTTQCSQAETRSKCEDISRRCFWSTAQDQCLIRPTIILSLPDDLGWYDVGFHNPRSRTPTLDALRQSGIALERHYVNRFCAPTRAMLLTGRHAWKIGLQVDSNLNPVTSLRCAAAPNVQLLPAILRKYGGYETHAFGKWHMGHYRTSLTPTGRGFDRFLGFYAGGIGDYVGRNNTGQFWSSKCACSGPSLQTKPQATCGIYAKGKKLCTKAVNIVFETATPLPLKPPCILMMILRICSLRDELRK